MTPMMSAAASRKAVRSQVATLKFVATTSATTLARAVTLSPTSAQGTPTCNAASRMVSHLQIPSYLTVSKTATTEAPQPKPNNCPIARKVVRDFAPDDVIFSRQATSKVSELYKDANHAADICTIVSGLLSLAVPEVGIPVGVARGVASVGAGFIADYADECATKNQCLKLKVIRSRSAWERVMSVAVRVLRSGLIRDMGQDPLRVRSAQSGG